MPEGSWPRAAPPDDATVDRIATILTRLAAMPGPFGPDTSPGDVARWDSLLHVHLIHAIEQAFDCELPDEMLGVGPSLGELAAAVDAARG